MRAFIKHETEADDYYVEGGILDHTVILGAGTEHEVHLRVCRGADARKLSVLRLLPLHRMAPSPGD